MSELELPRNELEAALAGCRMTSAPPCRRLPRGCAATISASRSNRGAATEADGTMLGQKVTPLDRVGLYVPGGLASYPSSVLMNAIPAKVAGVAELIMVVPTPRGEKNPLVLAAAAITGVDRVFTIGGAQAVAALAYGSQTVPRWTRSSDPAMPMWLRPSAACSARSVSTWLPVRRRC